jgi:ribosomal protein L7/L12
MKNPYAKVIAELQKDQDWRTIVFSIAQFAPSAVLKAIKDIGTKDEPAWKKECRDLVKAGERLMAIKLWREKENIGLKEAKDAVEAL